MKKILLSLAATLLLLPAFAQNELYIKAEGVVFKMIRVEGGTFTMGATPEQVDAQDQDRPAHKVTLSTYYIGETEVTQELWNAIMANNPSHFAPTKSNAQCSYENFVLDAKRLSEAYPGMVRIPTRDEWDAVMSPGRSMQQPVEWVSWNDCQEFCRRLSLITGKTFRLPTSAEWEYAARGGNKSLGYKYAGSDTIDNVAWYWENSYKVGSDSPDYGTHAVATKSSNELGLYDMSGNVYEWCHDWSDDYSCDSQTNPTGPEGGPIHRHPPYNRVCRGGSWGLGTKYSRVSCREGYYPNSGRPDIGLRLAL